jgi:hypothetical protein
LYSSNEFEEFDSIAAGGASTVEVAAGTIADSSFVVNVTNSGSGYITVGIVAKGAASADVDPESFVEQNVANFTYLTKKANKGEAVAFSFDGLVQNATYVVVAVATNSDGVPSSAASLEVSTADSYSPTLEETAPAVGLSPALGEDGVLQLAFDEAVLFDDTKAIEFWYLFEGAAFNLDADSVMVEGNVVTLKPGTLPLNREIVFVSWEEGTFTDLAGNAGPAQESGLEDGAYPFGLYYRVVAKDFVPTAILPEAETLSALEFTSIELTFDEEVDPELNYDDEVEDAYTHGITLIYHYASGDIISKVVTAKLVTINGTSVVINLPLPLLSMDSIESLELTVDQGVFYIGIGNTNAAISKEWTFEEIAPV